VLNEIPNITLEQFQIIFKNSPIEEKYLKSTIKFLGDVAQYIQTTQRSIELVDSYIAFLTMCQSYLKFNKLKNREKKLAIELKIAKERENLSEVSAKISLLNKLNESLKEYKSKLDIIKDDYAKIKNQKEQLEKSTSNLKKKQNELKKSQKEVFNQINSLTRKEDKLTPQDNAEIEELRVKAKNIRDEIKDLTPKIQNSQEKLNRILPKFKDYDKNYQNLQNNIKSDEDKIENLRIEVGEVINLNELEMFSSANMKDISFVKSVNRIKREIEENEKEIRKLEVYNKTNFTLDNLSFIKEIESFKTNLKEVHSNIIKGFDKTKIKKEIEDTTHFNKWLLEFQELINLFLETITIRMMTEFEFNLIPKDSKKSQLLFKFSRFKSGPVEFKDMTTPEKIFFIICFCITIDILKNKSDILFSNLLMPKEYNKKGSINRTLTKIRPIFSKNLDLKNRTLTFAISGFKLTKDLENVKIFDIKIKNGEKTSE